MKTLATILLILFLAISAYATTIDNNCLNQCMARGYSYDICARMCTY